MKTKKPIGTLLEEVRVNKKNMLACIGRSLAHPIKYEECEDFIDETTGDVITLHRPKTAYKRGDIITEWLAGIIYQKMKGQHILLLV